MNKQKMMKKILSFTIIFLALGHPVSASLQDTIGDTFWGILCAIAGAIYEISALLAILVILAAAALWVYSKDDASKRNEAKTWIIHALIGLVIIVIAGNLIVGIKAGGSSIDPTWMCAPWLGGS
ncbi:MAG: TrbC/VirB2 family protein [Methanobacteriota archaeon]